MKEPDEPSDSGREEGHADWQKIRIRHRAQEPGEEPLWVRLRRLRDEERTPHPDESEPSNLERAEAAEVRADLAELDAREARAELADERARHAGEREELTDEQLQQLDWTEWPVIRTDRRPAPLASRPLFARRIPPRRPKYALSFGTMLSESAGYDDLVKMIRLVIFAEMERILSDEGMEMLVQAIVGDNASTWDTSEVEGEFFPAMFRMDIVTSIEEVLDIPPVLQGGYENRIQSTWSELVHHFAGVLKKIRGDDFKYDEPQPEPKRQSPAELKSAAKQPATEPETAAKKSAKKPATKPKVAAKKPKSGASGKSTGKKPKDKPPARAKRQSGTGRKPKPKDPGPPKPPKKK